MDVRVSYRGWAQVAFSEDVRPEPTPASIGATRLILVRHRDGIRAHGAVCPHRGAHLGFGGRLDEDTVVICPFHGHRIRLGCDGAGPLCVPTYRTVEAGGAVYVLLDDRCGNGFPAYLERVAGSHHLIAGFALDAAVAPEYVIENVFDADHFRSVHGLNRRPDLRARAGEHGELAVEGVFCTNRPLEWQDGTPTGPDGVRTRFLARVFSPMVVASELGPEECPTLVITAATPTSAGHSTIRVLVGLPRHGPGAPPTVDAIGSLLAGSRLAFEQDLAVWEHLDTSAPCHFVETDGLIREYRDYCRRFDEVTAA
jgi:3-ketosteroid 9alpha-monooxygenase subunit A